MRKTLVLTILSHFTFIVSAPKNGAKRGNGIGIPDVINKIMQPFFITKPTGEGTGRGLSLTYDTMVKGHGESIQFNSVEGEGSEFIILLPLSS
jgi:two-component system NtrC family sensor kinase